ncbi:MAG TPA: PQQ-dependent sugar dehydrogenase [Cyclobacteriaceae bacterium]|nr:PQQ-dependent sugar dehydrogenase [Cyclobacteriaceae bacterium]
MKNKKLFLLFLLFVSCANSDSNNEKPVSYRAVSAFPNLTFPRPVDLQHAGDNTNRIFVVEQAGVISVFPNSAAALSKKTFLDIKVKVNDSGNEEGLLGLAFHPNYENNGFFYVNYTASNPRRTVISRFHVSSNADVADASSEHIILEFDQPYSNHNGGQITFGPDGYLYIATGDGGSGGDPQGNGQSRTTLLGKILRIDVNGTEDGKQYAIPADNPYKDNTSGFREEIYAYGLRNPWRFSFDLPTNRLWTGDVGQNSFEEIDIIEKGGNYGWNVMEGFHCFEPSSGCNQTGLKKPVWEYGRDLGISVTGGFVYRGPTLSELTGKYIYADYGSSRIWSLNVPLNGGSPTNTQLLQAAFNIASFGVDQNNELYLCGFDDKIYKLEKK